MAHRLRPRTKLSSIKRRLDYLHRLVNGVIPFGKVKSDQTFTKHGEVMKLCKEFKECSDDLQANEQNSVAFALRDNLAHMKKQSKSEGSRNRMSDALKLQYGLGQLDNEKEAKLMAFAKKLGVGSNDSNDDVSRSSVSGSNSDTSESNSSSVSNKSADSSQSSSSNQVDSSNSNQGKFKQENL